VGKGESRESGIDCQWICSFCRLQLAAGPTTHLDAADQSLAIAKVVTQSTKEGGKKREKRPNECYSGCDR